MSSPLFSASTIPVLEQVVGFAEARHEVLAGNIANLNTPGYHVRDLSPERFQEHLKEAIASRKTGGASSSVAGTSNPWNSRDGDFQQVRESLQSILYHDDSNVSIERQVAEVTKNQMMHNMALSILRSQFGLLQAAISERAG